MKKSNGWFHRIDPRDYYVSVRGKFVFDDDVIWKTMGACECIYLFEEALYSDEEYPDLDYSSLEDADALNFAQQSIENFLKFNSGFRNNFDGSFSINFHYLPEERGKYDCES